MKPPSARRCVAPERATRPLRRRRITLVLRLQAAPSDEQLKQLRANFRDVRTEGDFHGSGPLPEERQEIELACYARLAFRFNRRSLGRLRQLIDYLNQTTIAPPESAAD